MYNCYREIYTLIVISVYVNKVMLIQILDISLTTRGMFPCFRLYTSESDVCRRQILTYKYL